MDSNHRLGHYERPVLPLNYPAPLLPLLLALLKLLLLDGKTDWLGIIAACIAAVVAHAAPKLTALASIVVSASLAVFLVLKGRLAIALQDHSHKIILLFAIKSKASEVV